MIVSSSLLSGQPLGSTSPSMLDQHHYWIEYSRLVDAFRRVGKLGGKASLTASTEDGLWRASLEIQTRPVSAAQPGPVSPPTAQPAAPHQEDAAGRRRSRRRRGPASALRSRARARAHQATLAARRQGTCQTPATRVQAAPPPPPPPPPQFSSARLIKVVKKPIGSQFSFSNLDGARASIDSVDRLSISSERQEVEEVDEVEGTVPFPAASPESHVTGDRLIWNNGQPALVPVTCDIATEHPEASLEGPWFTHLQQKEEKEEEEEEEEKEEENETTDPMSTLESSRNPTVPCTSEVTTEPTNENRCHRPLQRARERRAARLQKESDAHAVTNSDPHDPGSQRSSGSCDLEQDRPQLQCSGCNNILTESDLSEMDNLNQSLKRAGWDAEWVEQSPACAACINHWSF